jgi:putative transposase
MPLPAKSEVAIVRGQTPDMPRKVAVFGLRPATRCAAQTGSLTLRTMPRPLRELTPGRLYHLTARGNRKQRIFNADDDRKLFLTCLSRVAADLEWNCHAYCLMENHYHLVLQSPCRNISAGLQQLNSRYAQAFNSRYSLTGHLFQGRFHSVPVSSDGHLLELVRYLAMNPVRAGLCARPEDWLWGSYRAVIGAAPPPQFLDIERVLDFFAARSSNRTEILRRFVTDRRFHNADDLASRAMAGV